jgi:hypothetical protein
MLLIPPVIQLVYPIGRHVPYVVLPPYPLQDQTSSCIAQTVKLHTHGLQAASCDNLSNRTCVCQDPTSSVSIAGCLWNELPL